MQEGFFQIPFPRSPCAVSSYSILARYIPKTYKPENSPHSLLTAAFVLASVKIFLSGSEGIQRSTLNSVSESFRHFCDVAQDQAGNAGLDLCRKAIASSSEAMTFRNPILPRSFYELRHQGPLYQAGICAMQYNLQHDRVI